jgi:YD repeat-containing protein
MLQAIRIVQPDGASLTNEFHLTGLLKRAYGTRTYPVGYGYDAQGRMKTMTNWSGFAGAAGARVTTWNYDPYRGWLANKRYPDATGPDYTYKPSGRLQTRAWARGNPRVTTTYAYNTAGDLPGVTYANDPAATPNLSYTYDRRGRQRTVVQGAMTTTRHYNDANLLTGEAYSGGTLNALALTNTYDAYLRRTFLAALNGGTTLSSGTYGYDNAGRLSTVTDGTLNSTYSYLANSRLIGQITHRQNSTVRMTETRQYDLLNRLTSIASVGTGSSPSLSSFAYQYNQANQRTRATLQDGSFWVYEYDALGQVTSGKRFWSEGTPVPGQQFEYGFDDIGNRVSTRAGGNAAGTGLRWAGYTNNALNQLESRGVPGAFDVLGIAHAQQTVSVNGAAVDYRRGEYFQKVGDGEQHGQSGLDQHPGDDQRRRIGLGQGVCPADAGSLPVRSGRQPAPRRALDLHVGRGEPLDPDRALGRDAGGRQTTRQLRLRSSGPADLETGGLSQRRQLDHAPRAEIPLRRMEPAGRIVHE